MAMPSNARRWPLFDVLHDAPRPSAETVRAHLAEHGGVRAVLEVPLAELLAACASAGEAGVRAFLTEAAVGPAAEDLVSVAYYHVRGYRSPRDDRDGDRGSIVLEAGFGLASAPETPK